MSCTNCHCVSNLLRNAVRCHFSFFFSVAQTMENRLSSCWWGTRSIRNARSNEIERKPGLGHTECCFWKHLRRLVSASNKSLWKSFKRYWKIPRPWRVPYLESQSCKLSDPSMIWTMTMTEASAVSRSLSLELNAFYMNRCDLGRVIIS